jgi:membrane protein DedA with SNARE-associated domain
MNFTQLAFDFIKQNGGISVIIAGFIEQVIVPIPSPIIPMAAGFLFVPQELQSFSVILKKIFFQAALPFAIGSTIGSTLVYLAAWFGGKWIINKYSSWLEIKWQDVEAIKNKYFKGNWVDEFVIFLSRAIPVVPSVLFSAACGAIRIKPFSFYLFSALGLIVRGMLLGWLGWQSGEALFALSEGLDQWEMIFSLGLVAVSGALLFYAYLKRENWLKNLRE